jgi:hypothetical protein
MTKSMMKQLDTKINMAPQGKSIKKLPNQFVRHIAQTWNEEVSSIRENGGKYFQANYVEIKYENLHATPVSIIRALFQLLNVDSDDDIIEKCLKQSEFKIMSGGRKKGQLNNKSFFRKGIVGDWVNVFDDENLLNFNRMAGLLLSKLKYM